VPCVLIHRDELVLVSSTASDSALTFAERLHSECDPYAERYGISEITISTPLGVADDFTGIPYFDRSSATELVMSHISCPA
jgi:hypothetical protein